MKTALYYGLRIGYRTYEIIAVTSEKARTWHGRTVRDASPTHGRRGTLFGRFETTEAAQAKIDGLQIIRDTHKPLIDEAARVYNAAQRAEQKDIDEYLKQPSTVMVDA